MADTANDKSVNDNDAIEEEETTTTTKKTSQWRKTRTTKVRSRKCEGGSISLCEHNEIYPT